MAVEKGITFDLRQRIGMLYQGNVDLARPTSPLKLGNIGQIAKDFYAKVTDSQIGPFSSLGYNIKLRENEDELSERLLSEAKRENNSPLVLFATVYERTVARALSRNRLMDVYEQGIIHIRHPSGFFALFCPPSGQSIENFLLIVPAVSFDKTGFLDKADSVVYVYDSNAIDNTRLTAYIKRKVKNKYQNSPSYKDQAIAPWLAKEILKATRDRMDQKGGAISTVQTPLE